MKKITPCLLFTSEAEEAANFYTSVFPNSKLGEITRYGTDEAALTAAFTLEDQEFIALNGPDVAFSESVSFMVLCEDQDEVDRYWDALTADGGEESVCGWLKDKYGMSWQIVPKALLELTTSPDRERAQAAMDAMMKMKKIEIAELEQAVAATV